MPFIIDDILDAGLTHFKDRVSGVYFCSAYPASYTEATDTLMLGYKLAPQFVGPQAREEGGRQVRLLAFTDGVGVQSGTPTHYAVVDSTVQARVIIGEIEEEGIVIVAGQPVAITRDIVLAFPNYADEA